MDMARLAAKAMSGRVLDAQYIERCAHETLVSHEELGLRLILVTHVFTAPCGSWKYMHTCSDGCAPSKLNYL